MTTLFEAGAAPADLEAERSVLGGLLLNDSGFPEVTKIVTPEDFWGKGHREIYGAMVAIYERGDKLDPPALRAELESRDELKRAGGPGVIANIMEGLPRAPNVAQHARAVKKKAAWRQLAKLGQELVDRAHDSEGDADRLARTFVADLGAIARNGGGSRAEFQRLDDGRYRMEALDGAVVFETDFIRRERSHLKGELVVRCNLPGAKTVDGVLSAGDYNFSSTRTREMHAKYLEKRAQCKDIEWLDLLEDFDQRVLTTEKAGEPAVVLSEVSRPEADEHLNVDGLVLLDRQPTLIFGDGGSCKSYIALYVAGVLAQRGRRVAFFDWELSAKDHRDRLERLFGQDMPRLHYARCNKPLIHEVERLRRIIRDQRIDFAVFDSISFATDGPAETHEAANHYFQSLRQFGSIGSLHTAHMNKSGDGHSTHKPFGSVFWFNGARSIWYAQLAEGAPGDSQVTVGLMNRKANIGPKHPSVGLEFSFSPERTRVRRVDLADTPDLAAELSLSQRLTMFLRRGARSRDEINEHFDDCNSSSLRTALNRGIKRGVLIEFPDNRVGLSHD